MCLDNILHKADRLLRSMHDGVSVIFCVYNQKSGRGRTKPMRTYDGGVSDIENSVFVGWYASQKMYSLRTLDLLVTNMY